jgi:hypothetical protein
MRNAFFIFVVGFLLGSSLGIGGLYTQIIKPTGEELKALEEEHGVLSRSLEQATAALRSAAAVLRGDEPEDDQREALDIPPPTRDIYTSPERQTDPTTPERRTMYADRFESLASELETNVRPRTR